MRALASYFAGLVVGVWLGLLLALSLPLAAHATDPTPQPTSAITCTEKVPMPVDLPGTLLACRRWVAGGLSAGAGYAYVPPTPTPGTMTKALSAVGLGSE